MLFGPAKTIHDRIIEALIKEPLTAGSLEKIIQPAVSIQGVYKSLRELIALDIIVKQKKFYLISNVWREKVGGLLLSRSKFKLAEGEQTVYRFRKLEHLDAFWKHSITEIYDELGTFPIFGYSPHQYWSYVPGRTESELAYHKEFMEKKQFLFSVIGSDTEYDKKFKNETSSPFVQIFLEKDSSFGRRDHTIVIGSHLVTVQVSKSLSAVIDHLYNTSPTPEVLQENLLRAFNKPGIVTMSVEHNAKKAKMLRKRLSKHFYIPQTINEKFDLF